VSRGLCVWQTEGAKALVRKASAQIGCQLQHALGWRTAYDQWIARNEPDDAELERQRHAQFAYRPKISIVVPTFNTPSAFLVPMIESVLNQTYSDWELCIADASSPNHPARKTLEAYLQKDGRIKLQRLSRNFGIAGNSQHALALASGHWVALLDHDDTLAPFALYEIVRAINRDPDVDFIYSDEDKINEKGDQRIKPHFKPDWSPDTLRSHNYICHLSVFRHDLIDRIGGFQPGYDGSQDYDLILRATERAEKIAHIPKILYHWRMHGGSAALADDVKTYAYDSARRALADHLSRLRIPGEVHDGVTVGLYQIRYLLTRQPLVSIIIANQDSGTRLRRCLRSIQATPYAPYEIIVADNHGHPPETVALYQESRTRPNTKVVEWGKAVGDAAVNNFAVNHAQGEVLLFLSNGIETITPDWLVRMLEHAQQPQVGAVGAKLLYRDETIQHGGIVLGLKGLAGRVHHRCARKSFGYQYRLVATQNVSAITAACLMMRRKVFDEVGGFDERYTTAFHDIDLCLKIRRQNYMIVWTPYAELFHDKPKRRGTDDSPQRKARVNDEARFRAKWWDQVKAVDPYYNPNLSLLRPDCSLKVGRGQDSNDWASIVNR
jgi:GT2 family glycosyltransferase